MVQYRHSDLHAGRSYSDHVIIRWMVYSSIGQPRLTLSPGCLRAGTVRKK